MSDSLTLDPVANLPDPAPVPVTDVVEISEDDYARIVDQIREIADQVTALQDESSPVPRAVPSNPPAPSPPECFSETGLSRSLVESLALKLFYLQGELTCHEIAGQLRLPANVTAEVLSSLIAAQAVDLRAPGTTEEGQCYLLTESGRSRARRAFDKSRYVGPAPVSIAQYTQQCRLQSMRGLDIPGDALSLAMRDLVLEPQLLQRLGSAVCCGQAVLLYGGPGHGKTAIARRLGNLIQDCTGEIFVPYAIAADQQILSLFDPAIHRVSPEEGFPAAVCRSSNAVGSPAAYDQRWRRVRRPVVSAGVWLRPEMLDIRSIPESGFLMSPLHIKANGGLLVLDDFDRLSELPELLNRWILPLEEGIDRLNLPDGRKLMLPVEQLVLFVGNRTPRELGDEAFLRRVRQKIEVGPPTERQFQEIFRRECASRGIACDEEAVGRMFSHQYNPQCLPRFSDPRDLLDVVESICRFQEERAHLDERILAEAFQECRGGQTPWH